MEPFSGIPYSSSSPVFRLASRTCAAEADIVFGYFVISCSFIFPEEWEAVGGAL